MVMVYCVLCCEDHDLVCSLVQTLSVRVIAHYISLCKAHRFVCTIVWVSQFGMVTGWCVPWCEHLGLVQSRLDAYLSMRVIVWYCHSSVCTSVWRSWFGVLMWGSQFGAYLDECQWDPVTYNRVTVWYGHSSIHVSVWRSMFGPNMFLWA